MKVRVLGCFGGNAPGHGMTSFLVNGTVALDAGWVSDALTLAEQEKVKDIFISHSHLDHTGSLPFIVDNNFSAPGFSLRIYARGKCRFYHQARLHCLSLVVRRPTCCRVGVSQWLQTGDRVASNDR